MQDIFTPLSDEELEQLESFLLDRIDDDVDTTGMDEGIFDILSLDGFFTAIVSGPATVPPSQWIEAVWGDFEPSWEDEKEFEKIFTLLMRHMNSIVSSLMDAPDQFEPLFMGREVEGKLYTIVDEWCFGYMLGIELCKEQWQLNDMPMRTLLEPIRIFGTQEGGVSLMI